MFDPNDKPVPEPVRGNPDADTALARELKALKGRLLREATSAVGMIESAIEALTRLDEAAARAVISRDDEIDREEVHIEEECYRVMTLHHLFARDFRVVATLLRVNADLERVADHGCSIAKQTIKLHALGVQSYPTALSELGQRVPMLCHALLNTFLTEDVESARSVLQKDRAIDNLDKRLFEECVDSMGPDRASRARGILFYRCGREMERVGDLMTNIAEDVIYLVSGNIVRHAEKKRIRAQWAT